MLSLKTLYMPRNLVSIERLVVTSSP